MGSHQFSVQDGGFEVDQLKIPHKNISKHFMNVVCHKQLTCKGHN